MTIERKILNLAEFKMDAASGEFSGYAAIFGNVDLGGDVIETGAFEKAIPDFLHSGFLSWSHIWDVPVAMPMTAREDDNGLFLAGVYHSTPEAQKARTITQERLAAGKTMGLSIGYGVEEYTWNDKGGRNLKVINPLFETGFVMVPMNPLAGVTGVKDAGSLHAGLPFTEEGDRLLAELLAYVGRAKSIRDLRTKDGRVLSQANIERLAALADSLDSHSSDLRAMCADAAPKKAADQADIRAIEQNLLREIARRHGLDL